MGDVIHTEATMTWDQLRDTLDQAFQAEMTGFNSIWWWTDLWDGWRP